MTDGPFTDLRTLSLPEHRQPEELTNVLEICNIVFTSMFTLEMILKLTAFGFFEYLRNPYNIFDGIIVIIRWVVSQLDYGGGGERRGWFHAFFLRPSECFANFVSSFNFRPVKVVWRSDSPPPPQRRQEQLAVCSHAAAENIVWSISPPPLSICNNISQGEGWLLF